MYHLNIRCRRCGAPKPSQEELDAAGPPTKPHSNMAPDGRPMRPGDWACPNCGDHNFARNTQCRKCGLETQGQQNGKHLTESKSRNHHESWYSTILVYEVVVELHDSRGVPKI